MILSCTWDANSLVGVTINAFNSWKFLFSWLLDKISKIGRVKHAVFPVPVCAAAITSLCFIIDDIANSWIGVGSLYPFCWSALRIGSLKPMFLKDIIILLPYEVQYTTKPKLS